MALALSKKVKNEGGAPQPPRRNVSSKGKGSKSGATKGGKKRFILLIGDEGAILVFMQGHKVVRRLFAPSPQPSHSEAIVEIMQSNPSVPLTILMDVIDQQYVPQTFPPVSSLSVGGLVKRRLDRDFQPEDLKGSLQIGRDKTGRKEWKYLLVSLAKTPLVAEWLDLMLDLPNQTKGIYLVPIEAVNYVAMLTKKLSAEKPRAWQLLISHNKVSGFRQVVTHNGKLIFTRVSQAIDDAIPAVIAGNIEQEIINTIEYLKRLEFRDSADLEATVIVSQDVIDSIDIKRFNFGRSAVLNPLAVAEALGLEQAALSADRFGDVVLAAAFGIGKKHSLRFTNAYIEKLSKLYLARIGITVFGALISVLLVGLAGMSVVSAISQSSSITEAKNKQVKMQPELDKWKRAVDGLNKDVAFKSAVVATYDAYIRPVPKIEDSVKDMTPLFSPKQRVVSMVWNLEAEKTAGAAATGGNSLPLEIKLEIDFSGAGSSVDTVDSVANELLEAMKKSLPQYDVTADPFPWKKDDSQEKTELLNAAGAQTSVLQETIASFKLRGVKKGEPCSGCARWCRSACGRA